jgi:hypothetical protein
MKKMIISQVMVSKVASAGATTRNPTFLFPKTKKKRKS